jgi:signal transduction histidine kinase
MIRSLRWRLVFATALIFGTMLGAFWLFSTFTVRRQFEQFLIAQRKVDPGGPAEVLRTTPDFGEALRRLHVEYGIRTVVVNGKRVVRVYPRELADYTIRVLDNGELELTRRRGGNLEKLRVLSHATVMEGIGNLYLLPPPEGAQRAFRVSVNRWLLGGLTAAAILAGVVMLTMFRRIFRPVDALTAGARALASGRLDTRVDVRGNDEVAELGRAFNTMAEAVERNERARRNMVSDVAHELRTPLTSIRVQLEAVQDGVVEPDAKFIASIAEDAAALSHLVDDLQQLSLADAGQLRLELAEVSVAELVERAVSGLEARITRDVNPELTVHADARRMVQVIRNLLVNAVAYARSEIAVTAIRAGDSVEIRVSDDGPGVPDEQKERIFDRFYRADASRSRSTGGAGLGLAIARQLVELHGGTIRYERPSFVVTLPA